MEYLLDSKSLAHAVRNIYNPLVFGKLWKVIGNNANVKIDSVDYEYLVRSTSGFLYRWSKKYFSNNQISPNDEIISKYGVLMNWINRVSTRWNSTGRSFWTNPYTPEPWDIATALANKQVIVTLHDNSRIKTTQSYAHSSLAPNINIVAKLFNVQTISLSELLYKLNVKF